MCVRVAVCVYGHMFLCPWCVTTDEVGTATRMKLIHNMLLGTMMASLAEGMALAEKVGLDQEDFAEVLSLGSLSCPTINHKAQGKVEREQCTGLMLMEIGFEAAKHKQTMSVEKLLELFFIYITHDTLESDAE